jgi:hypothetical protein
MASSRLPDLWTPLATSIPGIKGAVIRHFQERISALFGNEDDSDRLQLPPPIRSSSVWSRASIGLAVTPRVWRSLIANWLGSNSNFCASCCRSQQCYTVPFETMVSPI